jgi:hypothetical protein
MSLLEFLEDIKNKTLAINYSSNNDRSYAQCRAISEELKSRLITEFDIKESNGGEPNTHLRNIADNLNYLEPYTRTKASHDTKADAVKAFKELTENDISVLISGIKKNT